MGLCKCRTVTTLFCFEHRRNVCEKCVVKDHIHCVIKTYLQWLQDSEFDPNCHLCHESFTPIRPSIRLSCFDLFHWDCLENHLGENSGIVISRAKCPICRVPIIPSTDNTPVAQQVRKILSGSQFADQLPPLKEINREKEPLIGAPGLAPNNTESVISIDLGPRRDFPQQTRQVSFEQTKVHSMPIQNDRQSPLKDVARVFWNCITLRNVRLLSFGMSPRQSLMLVLLGILIVLFTINVMPHLLGHATA